MQPITLTNQTLMNMNAKYNNILGLGKRLAAIVLISVIGTAFCGVAHADDGTFRKSWVTIYSSAAGSDVTYMLNPDWESGACSDASSYTNWDNNHAWGVLTSNGLFVKYVMGQGWSKDGIEQITDNSFVFYYRTYRVGGSAGGWSQYNMKYYKCEHSSNKNKSYAAGTNSSEGCNISIASSTPGNYQFEFTIVMTRYWNGGSESRCLPSNAIWDGKQSGYNSTFTVPGFSSASSSVNFGTIMAGSSENRTASYTHYGTALTAAKYAISGTNASMFSIDNSSISESSVTVKFTPPAGTAAGTKTATLTITDPTVSSRTHVVTLTGNVSAGPEVLIGDDPKVSDGPVVKLSGYLKYSACTPVLTTYGFYYIEKGGDNCSSVTSGTIVSSTGAQKETGGTWESTITSGLKQNTEYYYKPFVKDAESPYLVYTSDDCGTFTTGGGCDLPTGDVIYYTIDASETENPCTLTFPTFESALANLKSHNTNGADDYWWDSSHSMLKKNIVFQVVPSSKGYGTSGSKIDFSNINKYDGTSSVPTKRLTIEPKTAGTKPIIYGLDMENSRWITVNSMYIQRDNTNKGLNYSAIILGLNSENNATDVGKVADAGIEFINCDIYGKNFCSIHAHGLDGFYMENCNLVAKGDDDTTEDTFNWGASIKFMNCKNIILARNNFKGAHANNIIAQNVQNMLVMNNVFWNDNAVTRGSNTGWDYKAFIRLIKFGLDDEETAHNVKNIGMYYNTFYLANSADHSDKVDFLMFGGKFNKSGTQTAKYYEFNTIDFMYNNCYSYDTDTPGRPTDGDYTSFCGLDISSSTHIKSNNFWAHAGGTDYSSSFAFGADQHYVDMSLTGGMVCVTAPNTPEGLIIKGTSLNLGTKIANDVSGMGAESITNDRKNKARPLGGTGWTYGAYQQATSGEVVTTIVWRGSNDGSTGNIWDNRSNWVNAATGEAITCVDELSENLKVIIPAKDDPTYGPIKKYPTIPAWNASSREAFGDEAVYAGTVIVESSLFAKDIEVNYGGAIMGVENLKESSGTYRYRSTRTQVTVKPKEWVLVGSVVRPFEDKEKAFAPTTLPKDTTARSTQSGDFYMNNLPHVYMQQFTVNESTGDVSWGYPFTELDQPIAANQCFAIMVANQYGPRKFPANVYYSRLGQEDPTKNGTISRTSNLVGRFIHENPSPRIALASGYNILNNSYPASISSTELATALSSLLGSDNYEIKVYNYTNDEWCDYSTAPAEDKFIKPQSGYIIRNKTTANTLNLSSSIFDDTHSTSYKPDYRRAYDNAGIVLYVQNIVSQKGSRIGVSTNGTNSEKTFNASVDDNAELYIIDGEIKRSTLRCDDMQIVVPLGVRNKSDKTYSIKFTLLSQEGVESVVLEDRSVSPVAQYDLLTDVVPTFSGIQPGDNEGRFYLNINYATEGDVEIPTVVDEAKDETNREYALDIFAVGNVVTVSASSDDVIETITITDMVGRSTQLKPSGTNYSRHELAVATGTYIVTATSAKATGVKKVIIK